MGVRLFQQTKNGLRTKFSFNYCTKFQTICFSLSPLTIHANSIFSQKSAICMLIMPLPNLHMSAICKLGKGIN
jgi:hypothetical protein